MLLDLHVDRRDLERIDRAFGLLERFPTSEFMQGLADTAAQQADDRFDSKESPEGQPWDPWSEGYQLRGAPFHSRHTLLHLDGNLQESIEPKNVSASRADVGSDLPYARRQNAARQFLGFVDDDPVLGDFAIGYLSQELEAA